MRCGVQDDHPGGGVLAVPARPPGQLLCAHRRSLGGERVPVLRRVRRTYVTLRYARPAALARLSVPPQNIP